jgi:hypothetical protein
MACPASWQCPRLIVRDSVVEQFMPNAINQCNQLKSATVQIHLTAFFRSGSSRRLAVATIIAPTSSEIRPTIPISGLTA